MAAGIARITGRGLVPVGPRHGLQSQQQLVFDTQFTEKFSEFNTDVALHPLHQLRGGQRIRQGAVGTSVVRQTVMTRERP